MPAKWNWSRIVNRVGLVAMVLLIVQYLLGLWTNVNAPATFYNAPRNIVSLGLHVITGDILFLVSIVAIALATLSRNVRMIVPAVALGVAVLLAGEFGMAFVNSNPNNPVDSFGMGAMFLVALFAAMALVYQSRYVALAATPPTAIPAPNSQPS